MSDMGREFIALVAADGLLLAAKVRRARSRRCQWWSFFTLGLLKSERRALTSRRRGDEGNTPS